MTAELYLGTQGWKVGAWVGPFYPHGTRSANMLATYARAFKSVEVGSSSFAIPAAPIVEEWADHVPTGFRFALKVPQQVTHERQLQDTHRLVRRFTERVSVLGERLGPLLLQMSPSFRPTDDNRAVVNTFCETLPKGFRWAMEFRHPGWLTGATMDVLRSHDVATVLTDARWIPRDMMTDLALEPTAPFGYIRWEGTGRRLTDVSKPQLDREEELDLWEKVVATLSARVSTIFGYFDNQFQGHAPHSARAFQERLGQEPVLPEAMREQAELF